MPMNPQLTLCLLGSIKILVNGQRIVPFENRKHLWALVLLVLHGNGVMTREWLAEKLWPDSELSDALRNLRNALSAIRNKLGDQSSRISYGQELLHLDLSGNVWCDLSLFDQAIQRGDRQSLIEAIDLYRGPLLKGCNEEWIQHYQQIWEHKYFSALETVASQAIERTDYAEAIHYLRLIVNLDPLREDIQRTLMKTLAVMGNTAGMIKVYRDLRLYLRKNVSLEPDISTVNLYKTLSTEARCEARKSIPTLPPDTLDRLLPHRQTPFIGRIKEVNRVKTLMSSHSLITLLGEGGIGKSRLALQVAEEVQQNFSDGVYWLELPETLAPELVFPTLATKLGVKEEQGTTLVDAVLRFIQGKCILLILDNCEHLVEACAKVVHLLLTHNSDLKIIVTSRRPLNTHGEVSYVVPPLSLPTSRTFSRDSEEGVAQLKEYDAIALFVERATKSKPTFQLTAQNASFVMEICRQLGGIALAIELAAGWLNVKSIERLASEVQTQIWSRTNKRRGVERHQQALRETIQWSFDHLFKEEQLFFARFSVFIGGWTEEAAQSVCIEQEDLQTSDLAQQVTIHMEDISDLLAGLVEQSMIRITWLDEQTPRFEMLPPLREYGQEVLRSQGEEHSLKQRHLDYFHALAQQIENKLSGSNQQEELNTLEVELENIRAALGVGSHDLQNVIKELQILTFLWRFWLIRHPSEAKDHLARALARDISDQQTAPHYNAYLSARARALNAQGALAYHQSDYELALPPHKESEQIYIQLGDKLGQSRSLNGKANVAKNQRDYDNAILYNEQALELRRQIDDKQGIIASLNNLGLCYYEQGEFAKAKVFLRQSLKIAQELEDKKNIADILSNLGDVACKQEEYEAALKFYKESLSLFQEVGESRGLGVVNKGLGDVATAKKRFADALEFYKESLKHFQDAEYKWGIADVLHSMGDWAAHQKRGGNAARLWGAAEVLREKLRTSLIPCERESHETRRVEVRQQLGDRYFEQEWEKGRQMSGDEAIQYAFDLQM